MSHCYSERTNMTHRATKVADLILAHGLVNEREPDLLEVGEIAALRARLVRMAELKIGDRTRHCARQQGLLDHLRVLHALSNHTKWCEHLGTRHGTTTQLR